MKANLLLDNPNDVRSGYLNLDPFAPEPDAAGRIRCDVDKLDKIIDGGELEELVAYDILDYMPSHQVDDIVNNWLSKLARNGTLTLSVVDAREVSRKLLGNVIDIIEANELLHGSQKEKWQIRRSSFTMTLLCEVFQTRGYRLLSKRIQNNRAIVVVQRP